MRVTVRAKSDQTVAFCNIKLESARNWGWLATTNRLALAAWLQGLGTIVGLLDVFGEVRRARREAEGERKRANRQYAKQVTIKGATTGVP